MNPYEAFYVTFTIILAAVIGRDAARREMSVRSWVMLTLIFSILAIPLYIFLMNRRKSDNASG